VKLGKKLSSIRDVAKAAGVSPMTVSRVLNSPEFDHLLYAEWSPHRNAVGGRKQQRHGAEPDHVFAEEHLAMTKRRARARTEKSVPSSRIAKEIS